VKKRREKYMIYHHSHFGVYALIREQEKILLIKKSRGPYTGLFDLPGGSQEEGELLEETLRREVMEETGCTVESSSQIGALDALFPYESSVHGQAQLRHVGVIYLASIQGSPNTGPDGHDSDGCVWHRIDQVLSNPGNYSPFVVESIKRSEQH
jgi:ADP-ribose pyrophosphatase YjhB (NUDIX family)